MARGGQHEPLTRAKPLRGRPVLIPRFPSQLLAETPMMSLFTPRCGLAGGKVGGGGAVGGFFSARGEVVPSAVSQVKGWVGP